MKTKLMRLLVLSSLIALPAAHSSETRPMPCDGPGPWQVCRGSTVQLFSNGCYYSVSKIEALLADGCFWHSRCDGGKTLLTYAYSLAPIQTEGCSGQSVPSVYRDAFERTELPPTSFGDFHVGDDVEFRGNCHGRITAFEYDGSAWIAADPGTPCQQSDAWHVRWGSYELPSQGGLPPDLYP